MHDDGTYRWSSMDTRFPLITETTGGEDEIAELLEEVTRLREALVAGHDALHQLLGLAYARPHGWHIDVAPLEAMHEYEDALRIMRETIAGD